MHTNRGFWVAIIRYALDGLLLWVTVYATLRWPLKPKGSDVEALMGPALRLALTLTLLIRALVWALPRVLKLLEHVNVHTLLAVRLLSARRSGFLTAIGWLSILSVGVSSCALSTTLSVMGGFRNDLKRKILDHYAHIRIDSFDKPLMGWSNLVPPIRQDTRVRGVSPFVSVEAMLTSSSSIAAVTLRGIDLATIDAVSALRKHMTMGSLETLNRPDQVKAQHPAQTLSPSMDATLFSPDAQTQHQDDKHISVILIGQELARTLRLFVGDEVKVVTPEGSTPKARKFRIGGIFYTGMYEFDVKSAYVKLNDAQHFGGMHDAVTGIDVTLNDLDTAGHVARTLAKKIGPAYRVRDWQMLNKSLFGALALEKLAMFITLGLAILVASFCIIGALVLLVKEKGREIAVLKAMGASDRSVVVVFLLEGALIGGLGAALGLGIGYALCFAAEHLGIRMNPEIYYIDRLPIEVDGLEFVWVAVCVVMVCLLATLYPSRMASRLSPLDGLRG